MAGVTIGIGLSHHLPHYREHTLWRIRWPSVIQIQFEHSSAHLHLRGDGLVRAGDTLLFGDSHLQAFLARLWVLPSNGHRSLLLVAYSRIRQGGLGTLGTNLLLAAYALALWYAVAGSRSICAEQGQGFYNPLLVVGLNN